MKDRIPKYAGRVRLTPVANQPNVYDMVRADEPLEEGTPLNKATLLDDETAELLGLTEDSNVKDAFNAISINKVNVSDITDNLTTSEAKKPLSANQGLVLNGYIKTINDKFDNGILKIENGGTGSNLGIVKTYIGQYEGTGTASLDLVLPYKPKAILIMGGRIGLDDIGTTVIRGERSFGVIEFSKIVSKGSRNIVVYYSTEYYSCSLETNIVSFNEANNTLSISSDGNQTIAFNNSGETHTYIMFG